MTHFIHSQVENLGWRLWQKGWQSNVTFLAHIAAMDKAALIWKQILFFVLNYNDL